MLLPITRTTLTTTKPIFVHRREGERGGIYLSKNRGSNNIEDIYKMMI
jgi:hypothetical protein